MSASGVVQNPKIQTTPRPCRIDAEKERRMRITGGLAYGTEKIVAYKHIPQEFAKLFQSGKSIQVGTHKAYREQKGNRADSTEGIVGYSFNKILGQPDLPMYNPGQRLLAERVRDKFGPNVEFAGGISFQFEVPPMYVFCASKEPDHRRTELGEAIYRINDLRRFAINLRRASRGLLGDYQLGDVIYHHRLTNVDISGEALPEGPLYKRPDNEWEKEVRIAWVATREEGPFVPIEAPSVAHLIERIA
jgi:hypothetical protein